MTLNTSFAHDESEGNDLHFDCSQPVQIDPTQFRLQRDGTFRVSIRAMASMAGVDDSSLSRSLRSAAAENPLPCARSLLSQGFEAAAVSTWGETGGIPEEAVPFILQHYASDPRNGNKRIASLMLLAFCRVGFNAYVKDRLGLLEPSQVRDTQPRLPSTKHLAEAVETITTIWDALEGRGLADDRDRIELKRDLKIIQTAVVQVSTGMLPGTSDVLSPVDKLPRFQGRAVCVNTPLTLVEWAAAYLTPQESSVTNKYDSELGKHMAAAYRVRHASEPETTTHLSVKAEEGRRKLNLPLFGRAKNGNAVAPKIYLPRDWDLMVQSLREKGVLTPDRHAVLLAECQQFREGMDL